MPIKRLLDAGHEVCGHFFNPNIHPLAEYLRRREGAGQVAGRYGIKMYWTTEEAGYDSIGWMRMVSGRESGKSGAPGGGRCPLCWEQRLRRTFELAEREGFDAFTSSLLYSRRQRHDEISRLASSIAESTLKPGDNALGSTISAFRSPAFLYQDFRPDWQEGINLSKEWEIYRQQYCGCLFSENDRYARELEKANNELREGGNQE